MQHPNANYFTLPSLPWMINIILWFYLGTSGAAFFPHLLPYRLIGPAGTMVKLALTHCPSFTYFAFYGGVTAHVVEAIYSLRICRRKGIVGPARVKWFFATVIFGGASLYELLTFNPHEPEEHVD